MSALSARELRAPGVRPRFLLLSSAFALGACAAPERAPLTREALVLAVEERDVSAETLRERIDAAGLAPFAVGPLPVEGDALAPSDPAFWRACALVWSAPVRAARRELAVARERATSAGRPEPIWATLEVEELEQPFERGRLMATVDVLGLLGLGPAATARELADEQTRAARARLELAAWEALVEVDRALAALATVRAERAALEELTAELEPDLARTEVLARHGRLSRGGIASGQLARHALDHRLSTLAAQQADARAALARAAGLPADATELDAVGPAALEALLAELRDEPAPTRAELLARSPRLRAALVEHAVAEARLMNASAARWPSFRLGPHLLFRPEDLLLGFVAATQVPWPGALDGELRAAFEAREAAREAAEDLLLAEEARASAAAARRAELAEALDLHAAPAAQEALALLNAAGLRYAVDPQGLEPRAHAVTQRLMTLERLQATRLALVEAALELRRVAGPELAPAPAPAEGAP